MSDVDRLIDYCEERLRGQLPLEVRMAIGEELADLREQRTLLQQKRDD